MDVVKVGLNERSYPIYITEDYSGIGQALRESEIKDKIIVVTDTNVNKTQGMEFIKALKDANYETEKYVFGAGESSKNITTLENIYRFLTSQKLDRNSTLIALGGGVVGDITGFAASTYLRGINFIQVPTTLLAQADSSVGGKTGIDFEGAKNIIGAFYQPKLVYININALRTLPPREMRSGLVETIKHGLIKDKYFFDYIDNNIHKIFSYDVNVLRYISQKNCLIKANVVEKDEKEKDLRAILNFGHTIGHAIESASNFSLLHGECVALGIIGAYKMAQYMNIISRNITEKVTETLVKAGLPFKVKGISRDDIFQRLFYDKKIKNGKLLFILPRDIGEVYQCFIQDEELIKRVIEEIIAQ